MPSAIGVMMLLPGVCYFVNSLATILAPTLAGVLLPWILLPCFAGEASLATWLLFKGIVEMPRFTD
jgi:hypothetical protein